MPCGSSSIRFFDQPRPKPCKSLWRLGIILQNPWRAFLGLHLECPWRAFQGLNPRRTFQGLNLECPWRTFQGLNPCRAFQGLKLECPWRAFQGLNQDRDGCGMRRRIWRFTERFTRRPLRVAGGKWDGGGRVYVQIKNGGREAVEPCRIKRGGERWHRFSR